MEENWYVLQHRQSSGMSPELKEECHRYMNELSMVKILQDLEQNFF